MFNTTFYSKGISIDDYTETNESLLITVNCSSPSTKNDFLQLVSQRKLIIDTPMGIVPIHSNSKTIEIISVEDVYINTIEYQGEVTFDLTHANNMYIENLFSTNQAIIEFTPIDKPGKIVNAFLSGLMIRIVNAEIQSEIGLFDGVVFMAENVNMDHAIMYITVPSMLCVSTTTTPPKSISIDTVKPFTWDWDFIVFMYNSDYEDWKRAVDCNNFVVKNNSFVITNSSSSETQEEGTNKKGKYQTISLICLCIGIAFILIAIIAIVTYCFSKKGTNTSDKSQSVLEQQLIDQ